jgi:hypothetical protein
VLLEQPREGWPRVLETTALGEREPVPIPLLVSANGSWHHADAAVEIVGAAVLVDGARRLLNAMRDGSASVPCLVAFGLSESAELEWHLSANRRTDDEAPDPPARVGTATERLSVDERAVEVTIESDPFVVPTALGYAPAILVRRPKAAVGQHLLIGARSLARPLEELRDQHGTLVGITVCIRKLGATRSAEYKVDVV